MLTDEPDPLPDRDSARDALALARENGVADPGRLGLLASVAGISRFLGRWLATRPDALDALGRPPGAVGDEVRAHGLERGLRRHRMIETSRLVLRDLAGAPLGGIAASLADLADACIGASLSAAAGERARPSGEDGREIGFAVIGMGKLGGRELNYSSDVDLIYVYGSDRGGAEGGTPHEWFDGLGRRLGKALSANTEDGICFRVDLDLRPEGRAGPLVNSLRSLEVYYESYGQTWERAAWMKARAVAGDPALGAALLGAMEPFVYRRWLDYATIDAIREMKDKIDSSRERKRARAGLGAAFDVKLGRGGIRELEFFVQALQLVNAGKRPEVRSPNTLDALARLEKAGLVKPAEAGRLSEAYVFFRRLEHRIQMRELAQTHLLPADAAELEVIAHSMGFERDRERFAAAIEEKRAAVAGAFDSLFREKSRTAAARLGPEAALLTEPDLEPERARALAVATGLFADPGGAAETFERIRRGPQRTRQRERAFRYLARIAAPLFEELAKSADADAAVRNLEEFLSRIGGRTTLLALLAEHPPTVKLLVRIFGDSDHLAGLFRRRPELIDVLVGAGVHEPVRRRPALRREARELPAPDLESGMDAVRRFRSGELLRIGMADLWGKLDVLAVARQLSDLADAVVERCWSLAAEAERFPGRGFVVLALGKLGGREMAYGSDVDLVFLYEPESAADAHERIVRIAQRFLAALSSPTREGVAYRVDTRLRPSGQVGPLVSTVEAFERYQREQARIWERQALLRARPVAGDRGVWRRVRARIRPLIFRDEERSALAAEVRSMREKMEKQIGAAEPAKYNLKAGRGGLVDVEFAAQFLQLAHGRTVPFLRSPNTLVCLERATREAVLDRPTFGVLRDGYRFLQTLENRLRIVADRPDQELEGDPEWEGLARRAGRPGGGPELRDEFLRVREEVRGAFERVLRT